MNTDKLPHLETFAVAAELSCFTATAKALRLSQAAISQRIAALEQALGVSLFRRHGGRVLLTEAGHRLYPFAQRIRALHQEARQEVTGRKAPSSATSRWPPAPSLANTCCRHSCQPSASVTRTSGSAPPSRTVRQC